MNSTNELRHYFETRFKPAKLSNRHRQTCYQYELNLRRFDEFLERPALISDLTDEAVATCMAWLKTKKDLSVASIGKFRDNFCCLWKYLNAVRIVDTLPTIDAIPEPKRIPRAWSRAEIEQLWQALARLPGKVPDAAPNTVDGWDYACALLRFALKREPTGDDLTTKGLSIAEKRLYAAGYSRSVVGSAIRSLVALWRFISDRGESAETAPKRRCDTKGRKYLPPGRNKIDFDAFEAIVGLKATRIEEVEGADVATAEMAGISLPSITGPTRADFDQYRREVETARAAGRIELRRLCGTLLFGWSMLYQEWAGIDGKTRNHWRFALLRFSEYLDRPPELDDLTADNLDGVRRRLSSEGRSAESALQVVAKLRAVWRFAWETGALAEGPPVNESGLGGWRQMRWSMQRFGRPSVRAS